MLAFICYSFRSGRGGAVRKLFLLALTVCMLLVTAVAQAAQITDVKWGVDKSNVLR